MTLSRKDKITGYIAKWIVVNIACRINSTAVVSLMLQVAERSPDFFEKKFDKTSKRVSNDAVKVTIINSNLAEVIVNGEKVI